MTHKTTDQEQRIIAGFQGNIAEAKARLRGARSAMKDLYKLNCDAGNFEEAAEINAVKVAVTKALAAVEEADAVGCKAACCCYDEPGPIILGGGR